MLKNAHVYNPKKESEKLFKHEVEHTCILRKFSNIDKWCHETRRPYVENWLIYVEQQKDFNRY